MKKMRMIVTSLLLSATMVGAPVAGSVALAAPGRGPAPVASRGYDRGYQPAPRNYDRGYGPSHYDRGPSHYGRRRHKSSDTAVKVGLGVLALGLILGAASNDDRD